MATHLTCALRDAIATRSASPLAPPGMMSVHITPNLEISNAFSAFAFALINLMCGECNFHSLFFVCVCMMPCVHARLQLAEQRPWGAAVLLFE